MPSSIPWSCCGFPIARYNNTSCPLQTEWMDSCPASQSSINNSYGESSSTNSLTYPRKTFVGFKRRGLRRDRGWLRLHIVTVAKERILLAFDAEPSTDDSPSVCIPYQLHMDADRTRADILRDPSIPLVYLAGSFGPVKCHRDVKDPISKG